MRNSTGLRKSRRGWQRKLAAAVALCAYVVSATGLPIPVYVAKTSGVAFPCMDHACGCLTADQCWKNCCCHTPEERLAWAREHHVAPPAELLALVATARDLASDEHATNLHGQCCTAHQHGAKHTHSTSDEAKHNDHEHAPACTHCSAKTAGFTFMVGIAARKCRGLTDQWCASGAVLPPPVAVTWQFQWDLVEWLASDAPPLASLGLSPPVPPPRV
jgi:hypothetical protein